MTSSGEVQRLIGYMPIVVRSETPTEWERKFCASMIRQNNRGAFDPSEKQISIMQRIVSKFQKDAMLGDDDQQEVLE